MFIAGLSSVREPPVNDLWTVPGEENLLEAWQAEDRAAFQRIDPTTYYHQVRDQDFIHTFLENREPSVTGVEGRKTVELFTAIYRSQRDHKPVAFPLDSKEGSEDFNYRLVKPDHGAQLAPSTKWAG